RVPGRAGVPEQRPLVSKARHGQFDEVQDDIDRQQRPGHVCATGDPAAKGSPYRAASPAPLPYALDALLAHSSRAQAVRAGGPATPDAGHIRLPVRMPEAGRRAARTAGVRLLARSGHRTSAFSLAAVDSDRLEHYVGHRAVARPGRHADDRVHDLLAGDYL